MNIRSFLRGSVLVCVLAAPGCGPTVGPLAGTQGGEGRITSTGPSEPLAAVGGPWEELATDAGVVFSWRHTAAPDDSSGSTLTRGASYRVSASGAFDDLWGTGWGVQVSVSPWDGAGSYGGGAAAVSFRWTGPYPEDDDADEPILYDVQLSSPGDCTAVIDTDTLIGEASCTGATLSLDGEVLGESYEVEVEWAAGSTPFR